MIRPWRGLDTASPLVIISSSISYDGTGGRSSFARSQSHCPTASLHIWLLLAITALFFHNDIFLGESLLDSLYMPYLNE